MARASVTSRLSDWLTTLCCCVVLLGVMTHLAADVSCTSARRVGAYQSADTERNDTTPRIAENDLLHELALPAVPTVSAPKLCMPPLPCTDLRPTAWCSAPPTPPPGYLDQSPSPGITSVTNRSEAVLAAFHENLGGKVAARLNK